MPREGLRLTTRGTIFLSESEVLSQTRHAGEQFILRVRAPEAARTATPGSFAHIRCDEAIPLRRPLSIMECDAADGWLEFLYRPLGAGLESLSQKTPGERVSVLAPIGNGFEFDPARPRVIAIGGGVGIPPMMFVARKLHADPRFKPLVLMGSEVPFPFELAAPQPSEAWPEATTASLKLLEDYRVPSKLASHSGLAGAFHGFVTDLARREIESLDATALADTALLACGPEPMLKAAAALAADYDLPCQLAVEEFMACGVGGCAGCTILVHGADGAAMKRVCVDGPVFDSRAIYP
ncbi:MAG: dihydroorotate dehydrogenase electron transfer subunit [Gammaproteobacteria bacterium]|jgi:dihydroorotate dehydrogenase electron transfer subunit